jgi:hypothetical protein
MQRALAARVASPRALSGKGRPGHHEASKPRKSVASPPDASPLHSRMPRDPAQMLHQEGDSRGPLGGLGHAPFAEVDRDFCEPDFGGQYIVQLPYGAIPQPSV